MADTSTQALSSAVALAAATNRAAAAAESQLRSLMQGFLMRLCMMRSTLAAFKTAAYSSQNNMAANLPDLFEALEALAPEDNALFDQIEAMAGAFSAELAQAAVGIEARSVPPELLTAAIRAASGEQMGDDELDRINEQLYLGLHHGDAAYGEAMRAFAAALRRQGYKISTTFASEGGVHTEYARPSGSQSSNVADRKGKAKSSPTTTLTARRSKRERLMVDAQ